MIAHVTAAALASENKTLAHPASIDSIPTSAGQEDHVSMAPWAGHKLARIAENCCHIVAIELLAAAHAIDSMRPLRTSEPLEALHARVRKLVAYDARDHRLDRPIRLLAAELRRGTFAGATAS
jgi:histidine ammonia-lyase